MALAARGQRDMDEGAKPITDDAERAAVRAQARRVHVKSLVVAVLLVGLSMMISD